MLIVEKGNKVLRIPDSKLNEFLSIGYNQVDESGEIIQTSTAITLDGLKRENESLVARVKKLEAERQRIGEQGMLTTDYEFYKEVYGGVNIPPNRFNGLAIRAGIFVNKITFNRIDENKLTSEIEMCICAVADEMLLHENTGNKSTETVGNHTVSYTNDLVSRENKLYKSAKMYLNDDLLYRGVY